MIDAQDTSSPEAIRRARAGIARVFLDTPQCVHEALSARAGIPVLLIITGSNT